MADMNLPAAFSGLSYPVRKTPGGVWLVVGVTRAADTIVPASRARQLVERLDRKFSVRMSALPLPLRMRWHGLIRFLRRKTKGAYAVRSEEMHSYDIHLDADDPNFEFLATSDIAGMTPDFIKEHGGNFRGPRAVVDAYNAPFRKSNRLRLRRATDFNSMALLWDPHHEAKRLIAIWRRDQPKQGLAA
jgi:hypothetical protein